jgi:septal ring factor EnvC (AmiA/AmiB activator)
MTFQDALTTVKQFGAWIAALKSLDVAKPVIRDWLAGKQFDAALHPDGWSRARLIEAFATLADVLAYVESVEQAERQAHDPVALSDTVERLSADVRVLRTTKATVEADVMALHAEAARLQATIDERRGEIQRIKTELAELKQFVDTLLPAPTA